MSWSVAHGLQQVARVWSESARETNRASAPHCCRHCISGAGSHVCLSDRSHQRRQWRQDGRLHSAIPPGSRLWRVHCHRRHLHVGLYDGARIGPARPHLRYPQCGARFPCRVGVQQIRRPHRQRVRDARTDQDVSGSCPSLDRTARRIEPKYDVTAGPRSCRHRPVLCLTLNVCLTSAAGRRSSTARRYASRQF